MEFVKNQERHQRRKYKKEKKTERINKLIAKSTIPIEKTDGCNDEYVVFEMTDDLENTSFSNSKNDFEEKLNYMKNLSEIIESIISTLTEQPQDEQNFHLENMIMEVNLVKIFNSQFKSTWKDDVSETVNRAINRTGNFSYKEILLNVLLKL